MLSMERKNNTAHSEHLFTVQFAEDVRQLRRDLE